MNSNKMGKGKTGAEEFIQYCRNLLLIGLFLPNGHPPFQKLFTDFSKAT